jgi:flagellar export protein FliJ
VKKFAFNLEKLLEFRAYKTREAEIVLSAKAGRCAMLDRELRSVAAEKVKASHERFAPGRVWSDFRASELYIARLDMRKERLLEELARAEAERETARLSYVSARKAEKVLDKLKERKAGVYYVELRRAEASAIDDMANSKYVRSLAQPGGASIADIG